MADNSKAPQKAEVIELASQIFTQASAMFGGRATRQNAIQSIRAAEEFMQAKSEYESGVLAKPSDAWGGDCFAPKMPKTHPLNLISSERNSESKGANKELVNRISKWLASNPNEDQAYKDEMWEWTRDETKTARRLFPAYADAGIFK